MKDIYEQYIAEKKNTWADSSTKSEAPRLNRLWPAIDGDAPKLWDALQDYGAYTRTTIWTRVSNFWEWRIDQGQVAGPNPYKTFRAKNPRPFRGAYQRNPCKVPFDDLLAKIERVPNEAYRNKMRQLLIGGLRFSESYTLNDGYVIGKGNKRRKAYAPECDGPIAEKRQYSGLLRACHKYLGVTPHKLRSARMTDMVNKGINVFELKQFAGWSNLSVAESYIYARDERIQELAAQRAEKSIVSKLVGWARKAAA